MHLAVKLKSLHSANEAYGAEFLLDTAATNSLAPATSNSLLIETRSTEMHRDLVLLTRELIAKER